jgi:hypothetical protein
MYGAVTPEDRAEPFTVNRPDHGHAAGPGSQKPIPLIRAAVRRLYDEPGPAAVQPIPRLVKSGNGLPGATGKADVISEAPFQTGDQQLNKVRGNAHGTLRRASERILHPRRL